MLIEIKNRFTDEVIFGHEQECNSLRITLDVAIKSNLSRADLSGADLSRANLSGADLSVADLSVADLSGANLSVADLSGANLHRTNLKDATYGIATLKNGLCQLIGKYWPVYIFDAHIKIGCQMHSTAEWELFDDDRISDMASNALEFWKENKAIILAMAKSHQKSIEEVT
jgi:hypothetical protein